MLGVYSFVMYYCCFRGGFSGEFSGVDLGFFGGVGFGVFAFSRSYCDG